MRVSGEEAFCYGKPLFRTIQKRCHSKLHESPLFQPMKLLQLDIFLKSKLAIRFHIILQLQRIFFCLVQVDFVLLQFTTLVHSFKFVYVMKVYEVFYVWLHCLGVIKIFVRVLLLVCSKSKFTLQKLFKEISTNLLRKADMLSFTKNNFNKA